MLKMWICSAGVSINRKATMTQDIQLAWLNIARRLQSAAATQQGAAVIEVKVVVNGTQPLYWTEPKVMRIEPRARRDEIIRLIVDN